ncbi:hypothetical protein AgCh_007418 [Apium graveolens]
MIFDRLKAAMMQAPILAMPNFTKEFILETDVSGFGVGVVLLQDENSIANYSKVLGMRAHLKSTYEKALMAIVLALKKVVGESSSILQLPPVFMFLESKPEKVLGICNKASGGYIDSEVLFKWEGLPETEAT